MSETIENVEKSDTCCPFCGGRNLRINSVYDCGIPGDMYRIRCDDCGAEGPSAKTKKKAWKKFRKRMAIVTSMMLSVTFDDNVYLGEAILSEAGEMML